MNSILPSARAIGSLGDLSSVLDDETTRLALTQVIMKASPSLGYRLLANLMADRLFSVVLTTNWDYLLEHEVRRVLPPSDVHVLVRSAIDDQTLSTLFLQLKESAVLLRLHGDLVSKPLLAPRELLRLDTPLANELNQVFRERGVIFVGYSLSEIRIGRLLEGVTNCWLVAPYGPTGRHTEELEIPKTNIVDGDDALFDNFLEGVAESLLTRALGERILIDADHRFLQARERISEIFEGVQRGLLANSIQDEAVAGEIDRLIARIKKHAGSTKTCLLFADDPSAPGGGAILDIIKRTPSLASKLTGFPMALARISPRVGNAPMPRQVTGIHFEHDEAEWLACDLIVMVDNVSFTGRTIELLKERVCPRTSPQKNIAAALLRIDAAARKRLEAQGLTVLSSDAHGGHGFSCPWGVTRPTSPTSPSQGRPFAIPIEVMLRPADFLPEKEFWFIPKPWGEVTAFGDNLNTSIRLLLVERFHRTSLHYHLLRDEVFFALDTDFLLQIWDRFIRLGRHQAIRVPRGVPHRLIALEGPCRIVEVAYGLYEQRKDIVRIEDMYNRIHEGEESDGLV